MAVKETSQTQTDAIDEIISQWKNEIPELESEYMALVGRLKRCEALIGSYVEKLLSHYELNNGAFDVLATLRRSGSPYSLTPTELFSTLMITSGSMTNRLKSLESRALIERLPNPNDARSLLVKLTPKGKTLVEEAVFPHVENEKQILEKLPIEVRLRLENDLKTLEAILCEVQSKK